MAGALMDLGERFMCYLYLVIDVTGMNEIRQGKA